MSILKTKTKFIAIVVMIISVIIFAKFYEYQQKPSAGTPGLVAIDTSVRPDIVLSIFDKDFILQEECYQIVYVDVNTSQTVKNCVSYDEWMSVERGKITPTM